MKSIPWKGLIVAALVVAVVFRVDAVTKAVIGADKAKALGVA